MSAVLDDYENALWNNNFYSLLSVISQLLLSHHIVNLKRTVNIPNLMLTTLVSAGLLDPTDAASVGSHTSTKKTSLMRVSPSMKALESVLNEKLPGRASPDVILEEEPEPDLELELEPETPQKNPVVLSLTPGTSIYSSGHGNPTSSVQTFHTAKSSDTIGSVPGSGQLYKPPTQSSQHRNSSSISTIGESGYSTNDSTPRLNEPAAFYTVKHTSKDFSPHLKSLTNSFPEKEVDSGDTKVHDSEQEQEETLLDEDDRTSNLDQNTLMGQPKKKPVASLLDPVPQTPPTPAEAKQHQLPQHAPNEGNEMDLKTNGKKLVSENKPDILGSVSHTPVKSMLDAADSPQLEEPFRPTPGLRASERSRLKSQSSAFATPRSQITKASPYNNTVGQSPTMSLHKRSNTMSDIAGLKKGTSSSVSSSAANSTSTSASTLASTTNPHTSKRFSLRGMFKFKSKNHSLDKLGGVKEDMEPSRPSKITGKSFSTPNFADFKMSKGKGEKLEKATDKPAKLEKKKESRKSFFHGRRKSEVELTAYKVDEPKPKAQKSLGAAHQSGHSSDVANQWPVKQAQISVPSKKAAAPVQAQTSSTSSSPPQLDLPPYPSSTLQERAPRTPATLDSAASQFTPVTADLNPNTIREVDDLDYLPAFDQTDEFESEVETGRNDYTNAAKSTKQKLKNLNHKVDAGEKGSALDGHFRDAGQEIQPEASQLFDSPKRRSDGSFGEELSLEPISPSMLRMPLDPKHVSTIFGSPFAVSYSPSSARSPRIVHPNQKFETTPNVTLSPPLDNLRSQSPKPNDLLIGEALFPKSLSAHEVESIVSLERSRSMRSIKSNGKRSSFINYAGSDENIVLGDNVLGLSSGSLARSGSVRRSGSILKNSLSSQSLKPEPIQLLDAAMDAQEKNVEQKNAEEKTVAEKSVGDNNSDFNIDESIHDFIEFSDFIDVDNLDFSTSPTQLSRSPALEELPFSAVNVDFGDNLELEVPIHQPTIADTIADISANLQPEVPPLSEETALRPDVVIVDSETSLDEDPQTPPRAPESPRQDSLKSPILDAAYNMAINQTRDSPSSAARPVSMSFKGFSGSAFKNQQVVQSGSHQLVHLYNDSSNESLAVGKGFGSSEEESDDEDNFSFDDENANQITTRQSQVSASPVLKQNETVTNKRQSTQPSNKFLSLHPPPGPFHHDRIPSLSDHSTTSSPRLLTSFISRIKKSPMGSPKIAFAPKASVRFSSRIVLYDTYNGDEYDRHPDIATCNQLTPTLAQQIKDELNEFKAGMHIHRDSQCYTHFF